MKRILVVEDDLAILRGLKDNLEFESYEVLTEGDGERGYAALKEKKPDLVILDLMLPKMSGFELCRKARGEGITTPILMLTARGEEIDRVAGLDLGADDYVTKPFSVPELLARVRALIRRVELSRTGDLPAEVHFDDVIRRFQALRGPPGRENDRDVAQGIRHPAPVGGPVRRGRAAGRASRRGLGLRSLPDDPDRGQPHRPSPRQT